MQNQKDTPALLRSIFHYRDQYGCNCFTAAFDSLLNYANNGNIVDLTLPILRDTEEALHYLIKLGDDNKLADMTDILNLKFQQGSTLFNLSCSFSVDA